MGTLMFILVILFIIPYRINPLIELSIKIVIGLILILLSRDTLTFFEIKKEEDSKKVKE